MCSYIICKIRHDRSNGCGPLNFLVGEDEHENLRKIGQHFLKGVTYVVVVVLGQKKTLMMY